MRDDALSSQALGMNHQHPITEAAAPGVAATCGTGAAHHQLIKLITGLMGQGLRIIGLLMACVMFVVAPQAQAINQLAHDQDAVLPSAAHYSLKLSGLRYLADAEQALTPSEAMERLGSSIDFSPPTTTVHTYWVLAELENLSAETDWVAALPMTWLNGLFAYVSINYGEVQPLASRAASLNSANLVHQFPVVLPSKQSARLLFRLSSDYFVPAEIEITSATKAQQWQRNSVIIAFMCLGLMLACFIFSLLAAATLPAWAALGFAAYAATHILFVLGVNGLSMPWLGNPAQLTLLTGGLLATGWVLLSYWVLRPAKLNVFNLGVHALLLLLNALFFILVLVGGEAFYELGLFRFVALPSLAALMLTAFILGRRYPLALLLAFAWLVLLCTHGAALFDLLGMFELPQAISAINLGAATSLLLLATVFGLALAALKRQQVQANLERERGSLRGKRNIEFSKRLEHDVLAPLQVLLNTQASADQAELPAKLQRQLDHNRDTGASVKSRIVNLLGHSPALAKQAEQSQLFSPRAIGEASISLFTESNLYNDIKISSHYRDIPEQVSGPAEACRRILLHLLDNAVTHGQGKALQVHMALLENEQAPLLQMKVSDQGPGLNSADLERLNSAPAITPEQIDALHHHEMDGGLGLSIVRSLVHELGGSLQFGPNKELGLSVSANVPVNLTSVKL